VIKEYNDIYTERDLVVDFNKDDDNEPNNYYDDSITKNTKVL